MHGRRQFFSSHPVLDAAMSQPNPEAVEYRCPSPDDDALVDGRARMLTLALPLIAMLLGVSTWWISAQPGNSPLEIGYIAASALGLLLVAACFRFGRMHYATAATTALVLVAAVLVERILRLFLSGWFDVPGRPLFMPVFSSLPVLYLMAFVLLPLRVAERVAIGLWLPISTLVTVLTVPYWDDPDKRHSLIWLLCYAWVGNSVYLLLFVAAGRRQLRLVDRYARLAERERELRSLAAQGEAEASEHRRVRDIHFEHTPLAVVEWGPDMRVRRWSPRAEQMFGWTEAEAIGRKAEDLAMFPANQIGPRELRLKRIFAGEQDHGSAIVPLLHRSGRQMWADVHNSVIRGPTGEVQTLVSMAADITESQTMLHMLNESEARFRSIFNQAAVGIALLGADGRWLNVNQRLCEITGYGMDQLLELDFQSITHPDDLERDLHMSRALMARAIDHYEMEKRYIRPDGRTTWVMLYVRRLDATGDLPARFVSVVECIDERKAAEERVRALTASLESRVAERTAQLRDIIQAGQRRNEELTLVNDMGRLLSAATNMQEAGQVVVRYLPRIFPLADGALYLAGRDKDRFERHAHWGTAGVGAAVFESAECWAIRRGEPHHVEGEPDALHCVHTHPDSVRLPHLCIPIQALGTPLGLIELGWGRTAEGWAPEVPLVKTVAEKIGLSFGNLRLREELSRQALLDPLTGLNNRRWLDSALRMRIARHSRTGVGFAVLMIDVDHFKSINDAYGHDAGDRALQEIGAVLARSVRDGEAAARFGGEEFTVLLDTASAAEAQAVAERMRLAVTTLQIRVKEHELPPLTVSIGVALYPMDGCDAQEVLDRADEALYVGKRNGRNQVCLAGTVAPLADLAD